MKIRHREYGEVDWVIGIRTDGPDFKFVEWELRQNGRIIRFLKKDGWAEVTEPRYVDVTGECRLDDDGDLIVGERLAVLPVRHRFCKKQWFDLPENLLYETCNMTPKGFVDYIQQFKKPCLVVEKEE